MSKIDISKLAERLSQLNKETSGSTQGTGMNFLNINDGRNVLRILPAGTEEGDFYEEVWVHYGVGKTADNKRGTMVVCPTTGGEDKPCPVCDLSKQFFDLSTKRDDSYSKQAKSIYRKKRVYYNVVSRDVDLSEFELRDDDESEDDGKVWFNTKSGEKESPIKVLGTGIGIFKDLLGIIIDPEYGDVTHFDEGLDLIITKTGSGQYNTTYDVKTVRKETPAIPSDAPEGLVSNWKDYLVDLSQLSRVKSYDELLKMLGGEVTEDNSGDAEVDVPKEEPEEEPEGDMGSIEDEIANALKRRSK